MYHHKQHCHKYRCAEDKAGVHKVLPRTDGKQHVFQSLMSAIEEEREAK